MQSSQTDSCTEQGKSSLLNVGSGCNDDECRPMTVVTDYDIGNYFEHINNIDAFTRSQLLQNHWKPPPGYKFPFSSHQKHAITLWQLRLMNDTDLSELGFCLGEKRAVLDWICQTSGTTPSTTPSSISFCPLHFVLSTALVCRVQQTRRREVIVRM